MEITAWLQKIVFQDVETGFMIGSFMVKDVLQYPITAKGNMVNPQTGLTYKLTLQEEPPNKYGKQYKIMGYETILPMDPHGIFKYITRVCKFVGPSVGAQIVDKFGSDSLRIMKEFPTRIAMHINGITLERAKEIQASLMENEINERQMVELETLLDVPGMHKDLPVKLINEFKSNAVGQLKQNPYVITMFQGIGFILADMVAVTKIGYAADGIERKKQVAIHCLKEEMTLTGSTWIPERTLLQRMRELVPVDNIDAGLLELKDSGVIVETTAMVNQIRSKLWSFAWVNECETAISSKISEFLMVA